jgi:DNA-binding sugar fermentation-stimulating protein
MSRRFLLRSRVRFETPLTAARLQRRYKRFFMDALLPDGQIVVAHCPNTGALQGCLNQGRRSKAQAAMDLEDGTCR